MISAILFQTFCQQSPPRGEWEQMVHREKDAAGKPLAHLLIEGDMYCLFALGRSCLNGL